MVAFAVYSTTDNTIMAQATPVALFALALIVHRARERTAERRRPHEREREVIACPRPPQADLPESSGCCLA